MMQKMNDDLGSWLDWAPFTMAHHHRVIWVDPVLNVAAGKMVTS